MVPMDHTGHKVRRLPGASLKGTPPRRADLGLGGGRQKAAERWPTGKPEAEGVLQSPPQIHIPYPRTESRSRDRVARFNK